jgi:hypothetical protein
MKLNYLLTAFFCFCFAQAQMEFKSNFWGSGLYLNGQKITVNEAKEKVQQQQEVLQLFSKAQTNRTIGQVMGAAGGFTFGFVLGQEFNKNANPNWAVGGAGLVVGIIGIVIEGAGNKKLKEAVNQYNQLQNSKALAPTLELVSNQNGIGIGLRL